MRRPRRAAAISQRTRSFSAWRWIMPSTRSSMGPQRRGPARRLGQGVAGVADQHHAAALPHRLQPQVVIDAAVDQLDPARRRPAHPAGPPNSGLTRAPSSMHAGAKNGGKPAEAAATSARVKRGLRTIPTR